MPPKICDDSIKHFLCSLIEGGSTFSPVTVDRTALVYIPNMGDVAPTLNNCPSLLYTGVVAGSVP
jgi:hypothetical protein